MGAHLHNSARLQNPALMAAFLASTEVVDWVARRCFEWVRDEIRHSLDRGDTVVTCSASEVLAQRTGFCYAKSHLLAALLRANGLPAGFGYQRLSIDGAGPPFCLHGFNAVLLPAHGWYRMDARGNRARGNGSSVDAQFTPMVERLAFPVQLPGEATLPEIHSEPLECVIETLQRYATTTEVAANLPDWLPDGGGNARTSESVARQ